MTRKYVGHMNEKRYSWIAQLVVFARYAKIRGSIPRSDIFFYSVLLSCYLAEQMSAVRLFKSSQTFHCNIERDSRKQYAIILNFPLVSFVDNEINIVL